jgi:hypothetical protein
MVCIGTALHLDFSKFLEVGGNTSKNKWDDKGTERPSISCGLQKPAASPVYYAASFVTVTMSFSANQHTAQKSRNYTGLWINNPCYQRCLICSPCVNKLLPSAHNLPCSVTDECFRSSCVLVMYAVIAIV